MRFTHLLPVGALVLAACADSTGLNGGHSVSLSFMTAAPSAALVSSSLTAGPVITFTKAEVVFSKIELRKAGAGTDACETENEVGDDHSNTNAQECGEVEGGPVLVELPLTAGTTIKLGSTIPPGTYVALEAKLRAIRGQDRDATAFLAAHPGFENVSVRVAGTVDGQPFTYIGKPTAKLELTFPTPLTVDADGINVTVAVDVASWFKDASGSAIDPRTANNGGTNAETVARNIRASLRAFEDRDHDGHDDHHGRG